MKKIIFVLLILTVFSSGCKNIQTANNTSKFTCIHNEDCQKEYLCYFSQEYNRGELPQTNHPQLGDMQCHKKCNTNNNCSVGTTCKEVTQWWGDAGGKAKMCLP